MKYQTVLFDADNTLLDFSLAEKKAHEKVSLEYGLPVTDALYSRYSKINDDMWKAYEKKLYSREEIVVLRFQKYLKELNREDIDPVVFNEKYRTYLGEGTYLIDGANEVVKQVKQTGAKIYIVTNGVSKVQNKRLNCQEFYKYLDGVCISEDAGHPKPDLEFFENASKTYNFKLDNSTVIIGDSLSSDIKGGNNAGIDTVWFNPNNKPLPSEYVVNYQVKTLYEILDIIK